MSFPVDPPEAPPANAPASADTAPPQTGLNSSVPSDVQQKLAETLGIPAESLEASGDVMSGPEPGEAPAPAATPDTDPNEPPPVDPARLAARLAARAREAAAAQQARGIMAFDNQSLPRDEKVRPRAGDTFTMLGDAAVMVVDGLAQKLIDSKDPKLSDTMNPAPTVFAARAAITQSVKRAINAGFKEIDEVEQEGLDVLAQLVGHIRAGTTSAKAAWGALAQHAQEVADSL